ncbi:MAG: radical SAM protein [Candidatus Aminicenantes bacterium]|nr:radical SAM protein [Candidatus Aminicenantes bacterium]
MKIDKILLIVPPALTFKAFRDINPLPPMGLGYLASVIEKMGIEVEILDFLMLGWNNEEEDNDILVRVGLSDNEIIRYIQKSNPDIIGVNCQFSRQYKIYHHIFSLIKEIKPNCITIAGGAHTTVCPEEVLKDANCDFILIGEAEESFKDFILKRQKEEDITTVDGLGWKSNGKMLINKKTKWISNLDSIPFPAYHIMKLDKYFGLKFSHGKRHRNKFSSIITSRGCPARCTFCSANKVWGKKYRMRSVDNVLEEMKLLKNKYGVEELIFEDDNITANPRRTAELFSRMNEERFNFIWDTPNGVGVWSIDENLLNLMKQSGCIKLNFPIESGSQFVLDNIIKKPLKLSKIKELIRYCKKINLDYGMFLIIGMPGEKIEDMWKSFYFAADCGCYEPHISIATPYPGTDLFDECKKNNYFSRTFTLDDLFIKSFMIKTPEWDERKIKRILIKGHLYLHFRHILEHPFDFIKRFFRLLSQPTKVINYLKMTY